MHHSTLRSLLVSLAGISAATSVFAGTISADTYFNDFTVGADDFTLTKPGSGAWSVDTSGSGSLVHNDAIAVSGTYAASLQHTQLGGAASNARSFSFGASVTYTADGVASGNELGIAFLTGSSSLDAITDGYRVYVRGTVSNSASIFLAKNNGTVASAGGSTQELRDFYGDSFTFSVSANYVDAAGLDGVNDALNIEVVVTNVTKNMSFSLSYLDTSPLTGNHFGIRDSDQSGAYGFNANWNSVSLAVSPVPEPASAAALASLFAFGAVALRRRRR